LTRFDWSKLVSDIELLSKVDCYEKVNKVMSLGSVSRLRRRAASLVVGKSNIIVDAGAGPGSSSEAIRSISQDPLIILVDPSTAMLDIASKRIPNSVGLAGIFENMPLADSTADAIVAMFSFRDAVDYYKALDEFVRILKPNGRVAILDIYRPSNLLARILVKFYIMVMVPLGLLLNRCPVKIETYKSFLASIDRMLGIKELKRELEKRFRRVEVWRIILGVAIFYAEGPRK